MSQQVKTYHIYAKDKCIFHSISEDEFSVTWKTLNNMIDLLNTEYCVEDLTYEELTVNRMAELNSSH
jgi:hypothetical protein